MQGVRQFIWLLACCWAFQASATAMEHRMNPIRKVVNLLMGMQKKVEAEGKQTQEMYDKVMCNAKTMSAGLEKSIEDAEERIPQLESGVKEATAEHQQLTEDLKQVKEDRAKAMKAIGEAEAIRKKDAATFATESANEKADLSAVAKAIKALSKGQASFLQTKASTVLRRLALSNNIDLSNVDRDLLSNFLDSDQKGAAQAPSSGEVLGILKQMHEEMTQDLADMVKAEDAAVAEHLSLVSAKEKEIKATTKAIEVKTGRKGEVAVQLTKLKNDLEDSKETLEEDNKFLAETKRVAAVKQKEHQDYKKIQAQELVALADTIKLLNDDDALDLFKKTLPSPSAASFLQVAVTSKQMKKRALHVLRGARRHHKHGQGDPRLDLLALALQGRKGGNFGEVIKKIDKLIANLQKEQQDDESKKEWCSAELDKTEDEVKWTARAISDVKKVIGSANEDLKAILAEIATVTEGIKELDKSVKQATKQRKEEHAETTNSLAESNAAKELLKMAYNRLAKFYNPKLVEQPSFEQDGSKITADRFVNDGELAGPSEEDDESSEAPSFVQVNEHTSLADDSSLEESSSSEDNEESDTADSGSENQESNTQKIQKKKRKESGGVLRMISILENDLSKQILEIELDEKEAQKDYEVFMTDSSEKRAIDSKGLGDKESAKAKVETELQKAKTKLDGKVASLEESQKELVDLHNDCDWLLKNFDKRKKARVDETDALTKAKAVLSGADYS